MVRRDCEHALIAHRQQVRNRLPEGTFALLLEDELLPVHVEDAQDARASASDEVGCVDVLLGRILSRLLGLVVGLRFFGFPGRGGRISELLDVKIGDSLELLVLAVEVRESLRLFLVGL